MKKKQHQEMIRLREAGLRLQQIAIKLNTSKQNVSRVLIAYGKNAKYYEIPTKINKEISKEKRLKKWGKLQLNNEDRKVSRLLVTARQRSRRDNLEYNLWPIDLQPLPKVCPVFGIALSYNGHRGQNYENWATIDRIDNSKGYVKGNVAVISYKANMYKAHGTALDHRLIADYIDKILK